MAGRSRSKNGVLRIAYVLAIHVVLAEPHQDVDAGDKPGHDGNNVATAEQSSRRLVAKTSLRDGERDGAYMPPRSHRGESRNRQRKGNDDACL